MKQKALIHGIAMSASILILTACDNSGKEETIAGQPYQYDCGDAGAVIFQVDGNDTAILQIGANAMVLTPGISASGAKYTGNSVVFWSKGKEATLTLSDEEYHCARIEGE